MGLGLTLTLWPVDLSRDSRVDPGGGGRGGGEGGGGGGRAHGRRVTRRRVCMHCRAAVAADFRVAVLRMFLEIRVCCFWRMSLVCALCALCAACIGVIRAHSVPEGAYTFFL